jgi:hypothetical protein
VSVRTTKTVKIEERDIKIEDQGEVAVAAVGADIVDAEAVAPTGLVALNLEPEDCKYSFLYFLVFFLTQ